MIGEYKVLYENEDGEWEFKNASKNSDDSFKVGKGDYLPKPKEHIRTLKLKTFRGVKRYKFFVVHSENPVPVNMVRTDSSKNPSPVDLQRTTVDPVDTATMVRSFRRAHIVESLGRASRENPSNKNVDWMKILMVGGIGIVALILYYTGVFDSLIGWLTSAPPKK